MQLRSTWILAFALSLGACGGPDGTPDEPSGSADAGTSASEDAGTPGSADAGTHTQGQNLVFAAVEEEGAVAVIDADHGTLLGRVELGEVTIHNVQGAPDGRRVWCTAAPRAMPGHEGHGAAGPEKLAAIDVGTLEVVSWIELGEGLHIAHVVVGDGKAYVTANEADQVLEVDLAAGSVLRRVQLPAGTGPHGVRLTPDGHSLVVAGMTDGSLHLVDLSDGSVDSFDLPGLGVQSAVLPDGSAAFVTIYDTQQVARLDLAARTVTIFDLPQGSAGPVQIYPAPDSRSVWVADQGILAGRPTGNHVVRLDADTGEVLRSVQVGNGPHGIVVDADGDRAWFTTLADGTVQSVNTATGEVLATITVGEKPNGITCVHSGGAMP